METENYKTQKDIKHELIYGNDQKKILYLREKESLQRKVKNLIKNNFSKIESNDKDFAFISFILINLPKGLIGLLIAVILSAAMSSTASELNSLLLHQQLTFIKEI